MYIFTVLEFKPSLFIQTRRKTCEIFLLHSDTTETANYVYLESQDRATNQLTRNSRGKHQITEVKY